MNVRFAMIAQLTLIMLLPLSACGGETAKPAAEDKAPPTTFPAGEWEVSTLAESLKSADNSTPATIHKEGVTKVAKVCAAPGEKPDPALFVEAGDKCSTLTAYAKNGRVSVAYSCTRPGRGMVAPTADGKYDADTFEVMVVVGSRFTADGDYTMTQRLKGRRLGDCTPGAKPAA